MKGSLRNISVRNFYKPDSKVELQHIWGYTAYLFRHIQYEFDVDLDDIQREERNLEMIIDREFGDIYAYRFDYPDRIAAGMAYYGTWVLTLHGRELQEKDRLRLKLLCRERAWN